MAPRGVAQLTVLVLHEDVAVVAEPRQREVNGAVERFSVIERRGEERSDLGEERESIARGHRLVVRDPLALDQLFPHLRDALPRRDVARDLRDADDRAGAIADRRDRHPHVDQRAVLAPSDGLERLDAPARADVRDRARLLVLAVVGDDHRDRAADRFARRIPEKPLGAAVPCRDDAVEIFRDDRVVARLDDGREPLLIELRAEHALADGGDQHAVDREERQGQQVGDVGYDEGAVRREIAESDRGRRQHGCRNAGPEAAVPRGEDDGRVEHQIRHRAAEPWLEGEARGGGRQHAASCKGEAADPDAN